MAIQFRVASSNSVTTAATTFPATLPVGWQPGDIAFVMIRIGTSVGQTWTQSAGTGTWTLQFSAADANGGYGYALFWRVLQTGDTNPTFSWATTSTSYTWTQISFFSTINGPLSVDAWAAELDTSVAANGVTANAVTAAGPGECSVILASARTTAGASALSHLFTPPPGWTAPGAGDAFRTPANAGWTGSCYQLGVSGSVAPGLLTLTDVIAPGGVVIAAPPSPPSPGGTRASAVIWPTTPSHPVGPVAAIPPPVPAPVPDIINGPPGHAFFFSVVHVLIRETGGPVIQPVLQPPQPPPVLQKPAIVGLQVGAVAGTATMSGVGTLGGAAPSVGGPIPLIIQGLPWLTPAPPGPPQIISAPVTQATATMSGSGTLTAGPVFAGTATLSGSGTLTAGAPGVAGPQPLVIQGLPWLKPGPPPAPQIISAPVRQAVATLSGLGTLTAAPYFDPSPVTLSGVGTLGAAAPGVGGPIPLVLTAVQPRQPGPPPAPQIIPAVAAAVTTAGTAALSGLGTLTAAPVFAPTATMSGSGTLTAGAPGVAGPQPLVVVPVAQPAQPGPAPRPQIIPATAAPPGVGAAALSGQGTLGGAPFFAGTAALSGQGTLTAAPAFAVTSAMSGQGTLTAAPAVTPSPALSGVGTLTGLWTFAETPTLSGLGTLAGLWAFGALSAMSGVGTITATWAVVGATVVAKSVSSVTDPRDGTSTVRPSATSASTTAGGTSASTITGGTSVSGVTDPRDGTSGVS